MPSFETIARRQRRADSLADAWEHLCDGFRYLVNPITLLIAMALFIVIGITSGMRTEADKGAARAVQAERLEIAPTDTAAIKARAAELWAAAAPGIRAKCVKEDRDVDLVLCLMAGR